MYTYMCVYPFTTLRINLRFRKMRRKRTEGTESGKEELGYVEQQLHPHSKRHTRCHQECRCDAEPLFLLPRPYYLLMMLLILLSMELMELLLLSAFSTLPQWKVPHSVIHQGIEVQSIHFINGGK